MDLPDPTKFGLLVITQVVQSKYSSLSHENNSFLITTRHPLHKTTSLFLRNLKTRLCP